MYIYSEQLQCTYVHSPEHYICLSLGNRNGALYIYIDNIGPEQNPYCKVYNSIMYICMFSHNMFSTYTYSKAYRAIVCNPICSHIIVI